MAAVCSVSSCSEDEYGNDVENVSFSLSLPSESTRTMGEGLNADLLHYYVYRKEGEALRYLEEKSGTVDIVGFKADLSLSLVKGWNYKIVFWADHAGNSFYNYDAETHVMNINYEGAVGQDDSRDAFYTVEDISLSGPLQRNLTLTRPFAQINVGTDDVAAAKEKGITVTQTGMTVKGVYNKLNLVTSEVDGKQVNVEFGMGDIPDSGESFPFAGGGDAGSEATSQSYDYLAMNYVLTAKGRCTIDVSVTTDNANVKQIDVTQVPVERNWRTNIYGSLLTGGNPGTEIIPDNLIEISTAEELKSHMAAGDSIILKNDLEIILNGDDESIAVSGKSYLYLNGKTLTVRRVNFSSKDNRCAFAISGDGASLTIAKGTLDLSDFGGDIMLNSTNTSITVEGVTLNFPLTNRYCGIRQGENVRGVSINITDSNLHSSQFCVYTDASNATTSESTTEITIQRSVLRVEAYAAMLNCVNGKVNISDSKLYGITHGLIMRGGTAEIGNSLIQIDTDKWDDLNPEKAANPLQIPINYNNQWHDNCWVPYAAVLIGNNNSSKYQYPTNITFRNDSIVVMGKHKNEKYGNQYAVNSAYLYANTGKDLGITFQYDGLTKFLPRTRVKGAYHNITETKIE